MLVINLNYEAAVAIVVVCDHFNIDPLSYFNTRGKHRYYVFRVLHQFVRSKYVQVSAPMGGIAKYAGYNGISAKVIGAPSQEKHYAFERGLLDKLYSEFVEKLQNRARSSSASLSPDPLPSVSAIRQPIVKNIQDVSPPVTKPVGRDIPSFLPSKPSGKQGARDMYRMLQDAVLNTGGKLIK